MSNITFIRGGTPVRRPLWCEDDRALYETPISYANNPDTPPYDSHADGAYNLGSFVLGMPINPTGAGMTWQAKALKNAAVGDIIQCLYVPYDHFATAINIKSVMNDPNMAGATLQVVLQKCTIDADGTEKDEEVTADPSLADAFKAGSVTGEATGNSFQIAYPFNGYAPLSLYSVPPLPAKDTSSAPTPGYFWKIGLKYTAKPTKSDVDLSMMQKGIYLSVRMEAFECPTNL